MKTNLLLSFLLMFFLFTPSAQSEEPLSSNLVTFSSSDTGDIFLSEDDLPCQGLVLPYEKVITAPACALIISAQALQGKRIEMYDSRLKLAGHVTSHIPMPVRHELMAGALAIVPSDAETRQRPFPEPATTIDDEDLLAYYLNLQPGEPPEINAVPIVLGAAFIKEGIEYWPLGTPLPGELPPGSPVISGPNQALVCTTDGAGYCFRSKNSQPIEPGAHAREKRQTGDTALPLNISGRLFSEHCFEPDSPGCPLDNTNICLCNSATAGQEACADSINFGQCTVNSRNCILYLPHLNNEVITCPYSEDLDQDCLAMILRRPFRVFQNPERCYQDILTDQGDSTGLTAFAPLTGVVKISATGLNALTNNRCDQPSCQDALARIEQNGGTASFNATELIGIELDSQSGGATLAVGTLAMLTVLLAADQAW